MWYPAEVSSLRSASKQAQAPKDGGNSKSTASPSHNFNVTVASELLANGRFETQKQRFKLGTRCESLNELLQTLITPGMHSLAADGSTEATTLSYYVAATFLLQTQGNVTIVDGTGSFDALRLLRILQHLVGGGHDANQLPSSHEISMLDRVHVSRVFDLEGLHQTIAELKSHFESDGPYQDTRMVIVDNLADLVSPEIHKDKVQGYAQLERLSLDMRKVALKHHDMFLLLNTVAKTATTHGSSIQTNAEIVPSLGRNFADLLDYSLLLLKHHGLVAQNRDEVNAIQTLRILKHTSELKERHTAVFCLDESYRLSPVP